MRACVVQPFRGGRRNCGADDVVEKDTLLIQECIEMFARSRLPSLVTVASFLFLLAGAAVAQTDTSRAEIDAQIKGVELALNRIQAAQQSVFQEFQMIQEMRRAELQQIEHSALVYTPDPAPPNYDDVVREKEAREARLQRYQDELDRLYVRYRELEEQKRPLLDELAQLATQRR